MVGNVAGVVDLLPRVSEGVEKNWVSKGEQGVE